MSQAEVIRRQVAICGTVLDRDGESAPSVPVSVEDAARITRQTTTSRPDGAYYFLDLPNGDYVVSASQFGANARQPAVVIRNDQGDIAVAEVDLKLTQSR